MLPIERRTFGQQEITEKYLGISLDSTRKFLNIQNENGMYTVSACAECECENTKAFIQNQLLLLGRLIEQLKHCQSVLLTDGDMPPFQEHIFDCERFHSPSTTSTTQMNEIGCECAKIQFLFKRIIANCHPLNDTNAIITGCEQVALVLEDHLKFNLLNLPPSDRHNRPRSQSDKKKIVLRPMEFCRSTITRFSPRSSESSPRSSEGSPGSSEGNIHSFVKRTSSVDVMELSDNAIKLCNLYWVKKYINEESDKKIDQDSTFHEIKNALLLREFVLIRDKFIPFPRMLEFVQEKMRRLMIPEDTSLFTLANDMDQILSFLTVSDDLGNQLHLSVSEEEDAITRFVYFKKIIDFFVKQLNPIEDLLTEMHSSRVENKECALLFKDYWESIDVLEMDNDSFASSCQSFVTKLLELREENIYDPTHQAVVLSNLLYTLRQNVYTTPGSFVMNLFPSGMFTTQKGSPQIHYHFDQVGGITISAEVTLIPPNSSHYKLVVKNQLHSTIIQMPKWHSQITIEIVGSEDAVPDFVKRRLQKIWKP